VLQEAPPSKLVESAQTTAGHDGVANYVVSRTQRDSSLPSAPSEQSRGQREGSSPMDFDAVAVANYVVSKIRSGSSGKKVYGEDFAIAPELEPDGTHACCLPAGIADPRHDAINRALGWSKPKGGRRARSAPRLRQDASHERLSRPRQFRTVPGPKVDFVEKWPSIQERRANEIAAEAQRRRAKAAHVERCAGMPQYHLGGCSPS
jgi:hypothetical protein